MLIDTGSTPSASGTTSTGSHVATISDENCRKELMRRFDINNNKHHKILHSERAHAPGRPFQRTYQQRKVDLSRLCPFANTKKDWDLYPIKNMKMETFVIQADNLRPDMSAFRNLDPNELGKLWPVFTNYHPWFKIPNSIQVGRTVARDETDVVYLDHMYDLVNLAEQNKFGVIAKDLPLFYLRDSLVGRRWNMFSQHVDITKSIDFWNRFRLWIPHDTMELMMSSTVASLGAIHPRIFDTWNVLHFPAGVPAPAPPSIFYFFDRIKAASGQARKFWDFVVEFEYALLFLSCWWHECERGQRGYVLSQSTIDWLSRKIHEDVIIDGETFNSGREGTNVKYITERMTEVRYASLNLRHIVNFPKTSLPPSYFVVVSRQTGHVLTDAPEPLPWVKSYQNGRPSSTTSRICGNTLSQYVLGTYPLSQ